MQINDIPLKAKNHNNFMCIKKRRGKEYQMVIPGKDRP